jgi:hypothetical protein
MSHNVTVESAIATAFDPSIGLPEGEAALRSSSTQVT